MSAWQMHPEYSFTFSASLFTFAFELTKRFRLVVFIAAQIAKVAQFIGIALTWQVRQCKQQHI